jgi:hypothetical protein
MLTVAQLAPLKSGRRYLCVKHYILTSPPLAAPHPVLRFEVACVLRGTERIPK